MSLHPAFQAYLDELNPLVAQAVANGVVPTPESARAALAGLNAFALPSLAVERVFDAVVAEGKGAPGVPVPAEVPDGAASPGGDLAGVPVRVYVPRPGEASDVVFFVHGGGHMAGDLDVYDFSARRTAVATGMVVVSVDYRRSPETPYPGGLTDTYRALHHLADALVEVATTGVVHAVADSGGGAKVASIAQRVARGEWTSPIQRQVLLYPSLDYTMAGQSMRDFGVGYFLSAERVAWYFDHYFPAGTDRVAASPGFGPFTASMPETLVIAAEYDPLLTEAEEYVARMQEAGAPGHLLVAPGMIHAYAFFENKVPAEIERTYAVIAEFLRSGVAPAAW